MAPQFKKLTDCPENLRESIDWLIQVRHGGDKTGLNKLAEAVKRLIDEAICEAESSLKYRESKLCCTGNASRDAATYPTVTPLCKAKDAEIEEAQKNLKTKNSRPYENSADSIKEIDALEAKIKKAEAFKNDCAKTHSLPEEERTKGLAEITQQKQIVQSLTEFTNTLENNNSNILTNLCSGLEKFLGFDSTSKGYDGTGIVYSDLDRLCDGVMAFLLSCLEGSKDLLTHYNEEIPSIIEALKSSIGKGRGVSGFASAIEQVKSGLQGYKEGMEERIENFKNPLKDIEKQIPTAKEFFKNVDGKNLSVQFSHVASHARQYDTKSNMAKKAYDRLDEGLKGKLKCSVEMLSQAVKTFKEAAESKTVGDLVKALDTALRDEKIKMNNDIGKQSACISDILNTNFDKIRNNLTSLRNETLTQLMTSIKDGVSDALDWSDQLVDNIEHTYKIQMNEHFEQIKEKLKDLNRGPSIKRSQLRQEVEKIKTSLKEVGKELSVRVESLGSWKNAAESIVQKAQENVTELGKVLDGDDEATGDSTLAKRNAVTTASAKLGMKAKSLLESYQKTQMTIRTAKRAALATLNGLDTLIKNDLGELRTKITVPITQYFRVVDEMLKYAVSKSSDTSTTFVQDILYYWEVNETLPKLKEFVQRKKDEFDGDLLEFYSGSKWDIFIKFIKKLSEGKHQVSGQERTFFGTIGEEIKGKVDSEFSKYETPTERFNEAVMTNYRGKNGVHSNGKTGKAKLNDQLNKIDEGMKDLVVEQDNKAKYSGTNAVNLELQDMISAVSTAFNLFTSAIRGLVKRDDYGNSQNNLYYNLKKLNGMLDSKYNMFHNSDSNLDKIHEHLKNLHTAEITNIGSIQEAIDAALSTVNRLEEVPEDVVRIQQTVDKLINQMLDAAKNIQSRINDIEISVREAYKVLKEAINGVLQTVDIARATTTSGLENMKTTLTRTVSSAFSTLTHQVQSLFAKQKQAELSALEGVVTTQLEEIERVIEEDKASGVKGFLRDLQDGIDEEFYTVFSFTKLEQLSEKAKEFFEALLMYVADQVRTINQGKQPQKTDNDQSRQVAKIRDNLNTLLGSLTHFNKISSSRLKHLKQSHANLTPHKFDGNNNRLLDLVRDGVGGFISELEHAYVSAYSMQQWEKEHSANYAKIGLTMIPILFNDLDELTKKTQNIGDWSIWSLFCSEQNENPLGSFFRDCGFRVATGEQKQNGELKNKPDFCGTNIYDLISSVDHKWFNTTTSILSIANTDSDSLAIEQEQHNGVLQKLSAHLSLYFNVCHLTHVASPKAPCSVYEMLCWLTGLQFNSVYTPLMNHVKELFMVPVAPNSSEKIPKPIEAYPHSFSRDDIISALEHICSYAYALLTTILGTGDARTVYACDFSNNTFRFKYPVNGEDCLDVLLDILRRLLPTLQFLYRQCRLTTEHYGWSDCKYGKDVASSKQPCKNHSSDEPTCEPNYQANCQPTCQPTSPLMSYLNDCLPGHLPHQLTDIGCKYKCSTCPSTSKNGMPCLTPLGFKAFSGSTKRGVDISNALQYFFACDNIRALFSLTPRPPVTLPEHFEFALCLVREWNTPKSEINALQTKLETLIEDTSIWLVSDTGELTNAFINAYGSAPSTRPRVHTNTEHSDVASLCLGNNTKPCANQSCAPYLSSLCTDSYMYLAHKHSDTYLSWAVYLPWTFWNYLYNLYQAFCNIACQDWGCRSCLQNDKCRRGQHGHSYKEEGKPEQTYCQCQSIVTCKGVSPTLYGYGFTFGNAWELNRRKFEIKCSKFCAQLHKVLKSDHFCNLFTQCDKFLFKIRAPFIWLNVALWLLSLFYLIHIMVIRLDLLHIKSHLHSPSSHRIAAQSLLAAARVKALNKVLYLQP